MDSDGQDKLIGLTRPRIHGKRSDPIAVANVVGYHIEKSADVFANQVTKDLEDIATSEVRDKNKNNTAISITSFKELSILSVIAFHI